MTKHGLAGVLIAGALILIDARAGTGADSKATRIAYPSAAASFIPLWAANDAGFQESKSRRGTGVDSLIADRHDRLVIG